MTNPTGRDELVERVARALIEPLGYSAGVDWERTWVGNECDDVEAGSLAYLCRTLARAALATIEASRNDGEIERKQLRAAIINTPETADFMAGVPIEAAHQRERWPSDHDAGKSPFDWFWLVGYLAQKAATSAVDGDIEKAKHHTISTAAALGNWHAALAGVDTSMRPGIEPPSALSHQKGDDHD